MLVPSARSLQETIRMSVTRKRGVYSGLHREGGTAFPTVYGQTHFPQSPKGLSPPETSSAYSQALVCCR
jgi:hypothetical protein